MDAITTKFCEILDNDLVNDIHLTADKDVWHRVAGKMVRVSDLKFSFENLRAWAQGPRPNDERLGEMFTRGVGSADFSFFLPTGRIRCNASWGDGKWNLSVRRGKTGQIPYESLSLPDATLELIRNPRGLLLVTGSVNSGKSTTLESFVTEINNTMPVNILGIYDPIEHDQDNVLARIIRREIGRDTSSVKFGIEEALVDALRQDPNVVVVGEIRTAEAMSGALRLAAAGTLVLATLHTNSAASTIDRVGAFYSGPERDTALQVLSTTLVGIQSQVMLHDDATGKPFVAAELMIPTTGIRANIRGYNIVNIQQAMRTGMDDGQITMARSLHSLVREGRITAEKALYQCPDRSDLEQLLQRL